MIPDEPAGNHRSTKARKDQVLVTADTWPLHKKCWMFCGALACAPERNTRLSHRYSKRCRHALLGPLSLTSNTSNLEVVDPPSAIETQTQIHKEAWRLTKAGEPVVKGSVHANFRGEDATIVGGTPPHKEGAAGFVETSEGSLFYPSVFGMVWSQDLT